ncbi:MAG TPA: hypothetical protein VIP80_16575, partial [Gemmatimonadales bacterium]
MRQVLSILAGAAVLASCGRKTDDYAAADSTARSIQLPPADSTAALNDRPAPAPAPAPVPPPRRTPPPSP